MVDGVGAGHFGEGHMKLLSHGLCLTILPFIGIAAGAAYPEPQLRLAPAQIQISSDAQLDRMERQGIVTPPLYDGGGAADGSIGAENRQMGGTGPPHRRKIGWRWPLQRLLTLEKTGPPRLGTIMVRLQRSKVLPL